jgi:hypothetical protein
MEIPGLKSWLVRYVNIWVLPVLQHIRNELELPAYSRFVEACSLAYHDALRAVESSYVLLALIGRPMFLLLKLALEPILTRLWSGALSAAGLLRRVVLPWLLKNGGEQLQNLAYRILDFHKMRTPEELLRVYAGLFSLILLYRLYRLVQHQRWVTRSEEFVRDKLNALAQVS